MQNFHRTDSFPPTLTTEEETKYINEMEKGSEKAKNILIEHDVRLVAHIVKKYPNHQKDAEDLISIGSIGLIKAVNTYNSAKKVRLATYAARCIENEILMYIRQTEKYRSDYYLQDTVGYDKDGNEVTLQDRIPDGGRGVDEEVESKIETARLLKSIGAALSEREKLILKMRYGLSGEEELIQREIAKILGISRSYVSRIEKKPCRN
ncbi:MAG: RNA polymerase sporulation sigma factor SigK [Clostridiales bacterium]|nr:RNA polymerase sporulation sigma factor SigK [Clostridiales bacterium]